MSAYQANSFTSSLLPSLVDDALYYAHGEPNFYTKLAHSFTGHSLSASQTTVYSSSQPQSPASPAEPITLCSLPSTSATVTSNNDLNYSSHAINAQSSKHLIHLTNSSSSLSSSSVHLSHSSYHHLNSPQLTTSTSLGLNTPSPSASSCSSISSLLSSSSSGFPPQFPLSLNNASHNASHFLSSQTGLSSSMAEYHPSQTLTSLPQLTYFSTTSTPTQEIISNGGHELCQPLSIHTGGYSLTQLSPNNLSTYPTMRVRHYTQSHHLAPCPPPTVVEHSIVPPVHHCNSGSGSNQINSSPTKSAHPSFNLQPAVSTANSVNATNNMTNSTTVASQEQPPKQTANKKERRRTFCINNAFLSLRKRIPNVPTDTKLSKIKTLRLATDYIYFLMDLLADDITTHNGNKRQKTLTCEDFKVDLQRFKGKSKHAQIAAEIKSESAKTSLPRSDGSKRSYAEAFDSCNMSSYSQETGFSMVPIIEYPASREMVVTKRVKSRSGWPQHVWALELSQKTQN